MLFGFSVVSFSIAQDALSAFNFVGEGPEVLISRVARGWVGEVDILREGGGLLVWGVVGGGGV